MVLALGKSWLKIMGKAIGKSWTNDGTWKKNILDKRMKSKGNLKGNEGKNDELVK